MTKPNNKGFAPLELILTVVIVAMVAGIGYYVHNANNKTTDTLNAAAKVAQSSPAKRSSKTSAGKTSVDFATCAKNNGASLIGSDSKTLSCVSGDKTFTAPALPVITTISLTANDSSWGSLPRDLQSAITAAWNPACTGAKQAPAAVLGDKAVLLATDANRGYARTVTTCGDGSANIFVLVGASWRDVGHTQFEFSCETIQNYQFPASIVGNKCFDAQNIERAVQ